MTQMLRLGNQLHMDAFVAPIQNTRTEMFWRAVTRDLDGAPQPMKRLVAAERPIWMTSDDAAELLAWCTRRREWAPLAADASTGRPQAWPVQRLI